MQTGTKEVKTGAEVVNLAGGAFREIANLVVQVADQVETSSKAMDKMVAESQRIVTASEQINQISSKSAGPMDGHYQPAALRGHHHRVRTCTRRDPATPHAGPAQPCGSTDSCASTICV